MKNILVDTDVLIDFSKGYDRFLGGLLKKQEERTVELFVTPVNITEFMTDMGLRDSKRQEQAEAFFDLFTVKEIGKTIGLLAGQYLRDGKTDYLGDALIAASAVTGGFSLATRNTLHFSNIPGLSLFVPTKIGEVL